MSFDEHIWGLSWNKILNRLLRSHESKSAIIHPLAMSSVYLQTSLGKQGPVVWSLFFLGPFTSMPLNLVGKSETIM